MPRKSALLRSSDCGQVGFENTLHGIPLSIYDSLREAQYKYQINKKWRLRKNIPTSKKAAINQKYQQLSSAKMSAVIKYKGQEVDPKKLRRQAKMETRRNLMGAQAKETRFGDLDIASPLVSPFAKM
jgi:hypothetical protein